MLKVINDSRARALRDRADGDGAYFNALCLQAELTIKIVALGTAACIDPVKDLAGYRYAGEYELVRASGIGGWQFVLNQMLAGPTALTFAPAASQVTRDFTQKIPASAPS